MSHTLYALLVLAFLASTGAMLAIVAACALGGVGRRVL